MSWIGETWNEGIIVPVPDQQFIARPSSFQLQHKKQTRLSAILHRVLSYDQPTNNDENPMPVNRPIVVARPGEHDIRIEHQAEDRSDAADLMLLENAGRNPLQASLHHNQLEGISFQLDEGSVSFLTRH